MSRSGLDLQRGGIAVLDSDGNVTWTDDRWADEDDEESLPRVPIGMSLLRRYREDPDSRTQAIANAIVAIFEGKATYFELEHRAYRLLNQVLDEIDGRDLPGLDAIAEYLSRTLALADQLVLPLHGAPPLMSAAAVDAREAINRRLDRFIARGRADHSIRAAVNATDVIVFSALITQPLPHGPDWPRIAQRQIAIFVNGLAWGSPIDLPGPAVPPVTTKSMPDGVRSPQMWAFGGESTLYSS